MTDSMMPSGLIISDIIEYAATYYGDSEIVTQRIEGDLHRYTYSDALKRIKQLANALIGLGVKQGDCIGTLAWNTYRHFEVYYAVSGMGAVTHTINPRLFLEQITYIVNHAEDQYLFVDATFVPLLEKIQHTLPSVKGYVLMVDRDCLPSTTLSNAVYYEELIANESEQYQWPELDEALGTTLCYTSGTTGNPKGVLYTHRSTLLHANACTPPEVCNMSNRTVVLPVVPMFHVCAWGTPYSAPLAGAKLVFPGAAMDAPSLSKLIRDEAATFLLGVPTIWSALLTHLASTGETLTQVERVLIGGAAAPLSMIKAFEENHGVQVFHAWGMTEMSPIGTICVLPKEASGWTQEERYRLQQKQGRAVFGVKMKIVNDNGDTLPHDGKAFGALLVKGPWIVQRYFRAEEDAVNEMGWFDTGDVATIDAMGYLQIVDRKKDVIKSGGEWISSIDLENIAVGHPNVQEACVIGVTHPKWDERPLLLVVPVEGQTVTDADIQDYLKGKIAKWWTPDAVVVVESLPHTATGKLLKMKLRETYQDYLLN